MFKYALFLVVALCAVQGFEARTVQVDDRGVEEIINGIKEIIKKFGDSIANSIAQIPEFIQNTYDKMKEIVENINLPGLIAEIKEEIEQIIALGEAGKKCVEAEREQIDGLIQDAEAGVDACVATAQSFSDEVQDEVFALKDMANKLSEDISARVDKCVKNSQMNPLLLFNCLRDQVPAVTEELTKLEQQVENTIVNMTEIAKGIASNLASCVQNVRDETVAKEQAIITSIKECVAGSV